MSDDHTFDNDDDGDDPLARIRARFEQASERILSGADDDIDLPPPVASADPAFADPATSVSTLSSVDDSEFDDFGEIDIQADARFSLDYEHGASRSDSETAPRTTPASIDHLIGPADLENNLAIVREDAADHVAPNVDDARHGKHRTRGQVDFGASGSDDAEVEEPENMAPTPEPEPPKRTRSKDKTDKTAKRKVEAPRAVAATPAAAPARAEDPAKKSRFGLALIAIVLLAAGGGAAFFLLSPSDTTNPAPTTTAATTSTVAVVETPTEAAVTALDAFGFANLQVDVDEAGLATIAGTVRTGREREIAIETVMSVDGVTGVVTDITYTISRDIAAVRADVAAFALTVNHPVTMAVVDGIATVTGIVPEDAVESGELGTGGIVESRLLDVDGVEEVRFELTLRGDADRLSEEITKLLTDIPIVYDRDTEVRPTESDATLDAIAALMDEEPGLPIWIAARGDDKEKTLELAEQRRDEVVSYLTSAGVDPALLQTVLVATLAPETLDLSGDVLIEVVRP